MSVGANAMYGEIAKVILRLGMMETVTEYDSFQEFVAIGPNSRGQVSLLLLEHEAQMNDSYLLALTRWSRGDLERMSRFRHQGAKTSWCVSRFLFRQVMRATYGYELSRLRFVHGRHGKPYLEESTVHFNWSHATGCVAMALASDFEIGCDIEDLMRNSLVDDDIPDWIFTTDERQWIARAGSATLRRHRMLCLFVQKEAQLKASGDGLSDSVLNMHCVTQDPPFRHQHLCCFRHGPAQRFIVAVCASTDNRQAKIPATERQLEMSLRIRLHRFSRATHA